MSHWLAGFVFLGLITSAGCAMSPMASPPDIVAVTGRGSVTAAPDTASIQIGVESRAPQLTEALADSIQRTTRVLETVHALGVNERDTSTIRYTIDPISAPRRTEGDAARIDGYRVTYMAQIRIRDITLVGRILDEVVREGANTISSVTFMVNDRSAVEARARALAVRDAANRAQQLVEAAGARLGPLLWLSEGVTSRPFASPVTRGAMIGGIASVPVEPGELDILVTVEAHYRITR